MATEAASIRLKFLGHPAIEHYMSHGDKKPWAVGEERAVPAERAEKMLKDFPSAFERVKAGK